MTARGKRAGREGPCGRTVVGSVAGLGVLGL